MKFYVIFFGLFLATSLCQAQNTTKDTLLQHYYQYPQEALETAAAMYETAQSEHNTPLLIKSLILKTTFSLQINQEDYPQILKELEAYTQQEKDVPAKCILHSYLGELYLKYYHQHQYNIRERKALQGEIPEHITEWSSNLFQEKILNHFSASLLPQKILQQTPVNTYQAILIHGDASDSLRPTLYDFLSHRAIKCLNDNRYDFPAPYPNENANVLGDLQDFLQIPVSPSSLDAQSHILKFWQELLRFRCKAQQENALLMADLERLNYSYTISGRIDKDSLYLQTLANMRKKYANTPLVVEVIAKEAYFLLYGLVKTDLRYFQHLSKDISGNNREKALLLCQSGIKQFPEYNRTNQLRNLLRYIQAPELQIESPQQLYPGEKLPIKISFRALSHINIQLKKIHIRSEIYWNNKNKSLPATQIYATSYRLPYNLQQQDTTIYLSVPKAGLYEITLKIPDIKDSITQSFICSQLFCASQNRQQQRNFQVNDWKSGLPVKNAKILIYKELSPKPILIDSVFTNAKGWATYHNKKNYLWFQVINPTNPNGCISYTFMPYTPEKERDQTSLITDRSIYKPGQIVYFQGITWRATTDTLYPLTKKNISIQLRDGKGKIISELKAITNSFGSFTGNFILPEQLLNGTYSLTSNLGGTSLFHVEEYKRPEFDITFQESQQIYYIGDTIRITGQVKSFSGISLAGQEIQYDISSFFWGRYATNGNAFQGVTTTDQQGNFSITFKAQPQIVMTGYNLPLYYSINAKVTDSKGETQESKFQVTAFPGVATPVLSIPQQVNKADSTPFIIQLEHFPPQAQMQTVQYSIYQLKTPATMLTGLHMQDTVKNRIVLQGTLRITQKDTLFPDLSTEPSGAYLFSLKYGKTETKEIFYLYSVQDQKPPIPTYFWTVKEKTTCFPGDTARIRFGTSAQNAYILYEIYNEKKIIRRKYTNLSDEIMNIDIPYLAEYGKNIWLTIFYVKDKKDFQETIQINQQENNRHLTFQTLTFRDHLVPGQQEEWNIRILNEQGKNVPTQALAFMYDASLDKLNRHTINFHPAYLYPGYSYTWNIPYQYQQPDNKKLYYTISGLQEYPDFQFDKLNTFQYLYPRFTTTKSVAMEFADFDDEKEAGIPHITGAKKMTINALGRGQEVAPDASSQDDEAGEDNSLSNKITYRSDFQETAFFYPQLQTDSTGELNIRFKVPQSLTKWKLNILAYTRQLAYGTLTRYITTSKPLIVRPNLPRFFRSGDQTILKVTVSNLSDSLQQGTAGVELFVPGSQEILQKQTTGFRINGKENQTLDFALKIPENTDLIGCRIFAGNKTFNDGEQHLLPVLPNEVLLTSTCPIYATQTGTHTYTLNPSSSSRKNYRLTLELSANPIWYAVLALPALTEPRQENATDIGASFYVNTIANKIIRSNPAIAAAIRQWKNTPGTPALLSRLEQNAELKSILLEASPWMLEAENETEQMQKLVELFDENRLHHLQEQAVNQLKKLQNPDGGWSWFKGMHSSQFMTTNILTILERSITVGDFQANEAIKQMQIKALRYLDKEISTDFKNNNISYNQLLYLYTRSFYRDIPLGDALEAHKYYINLTRKKWAAFSLYEKAISAIALNNYGFKEEARNILKSLRQYAVTTPEDGMYWPNNRNQYYRNSAVQIHTAIMEAFILTEGNSADVNLMKQWLLRQKQVQNWGSVPSTIDAIYTLLLTGNDLLTTKENLAVRLGSQKLSISGETDPIGYLKRSYSSGDIRPDMLTVKMTKQTDAPSWGGLYLQYFEKLDQIKKQKTEVSVDKKLYIEKINARGKAELYPLDKHPLKVGDKIIVRLTLTLNRDMEFLHLKDLRAACFEPLESLSGNQWKFGTVYYQEIKNAATNFFFNALSRGTYVLEYPVWINQAGTYQDGMATFQSIYAPEYNAFSNTEKIVVNP